MEGILVDSGASDTPSLVILDMGLPRLGGLDVQKELKSRAETRSIPIMVVSGTGTRDLDPADFTCVMRKPITAQELIAAVEDCLRAVIVQRRALPTGGPGLCRRIRRRREAGSRRE
jgi:DNA-binding response OmpR family regulator